MKDGTKDKFATIDKVKLKSIFIEISQDGSSNPDYKGFADGTNHGGYFVFNSKDGSLNPKTKIELGGKNLVIIGHGNPGRNGSFTVSGVSTSGINNMLNKYKSNEKTLTLNSLRVQICHVKSGSNYLSQITKNISCEDISAPTAYSAILQNGVFMDFSENSDITCNPKEFFGKFKDFLNGGPCPRCLENMRFREGGTTGKDFDARGARQRILELQSGGQVKNKRQRSRT